MKISADTAKCAGQSPNGTNVCGYRETCLRYKAPANPRQFWEDYYIGDDDCLHYMSMTNER